MNNTLVDSNVYYLPLRSAEPTVIEPEWPTLPSRLRNAWWRLRLAFAEMRGILSARRRRLGGEDYAALFADEPTPPGRRPRPARVIDFESARRRLRPALET